MTDKGPTGRQKQGQRLRTVQADEDRTRGKQIPVKNKEVLLSVVVEKAVFCRDNMGAVVGTLTMQTKQRRPSRGTSMLVQNRQRSLKSNRKNISLSNRKKQTNKHVEQLKYIVCVWGFFSMFCMCANLTKLNIFTFGPVEKSENYNND